MEQFTVWVVFVLFVLLFCLWKPNAARIFLGFFLLVMAIGVNVVTVLAAPQSYIALGADALIPFYRWGFLNIIALNPPLFVLPIAACQIAIALMMLGKGKTVKIGLAGGVLFLLATNRLGCGRCPTR